jgi:serine protease Do
MRRKTMKQKLMLTLVVVVALLAIAGYATGLIPASIASAQTQPGVAAGSPAVLSAPRFSTLTDYETALENVYAQVNPSVVAIEVVTQQSASSRTPAVPGFRGQQQQLPQAPVQQALGSGFVWDAQGDIVTNNHVVADATRITVTFADGTIAQAKLVGADPDSDLAVIKVDQPASQLRPVQVADSNQVKVGQFAIAIGNPFGEQNTMTTGIVSALGRTLPAGSANVQGPSYTIPDIIQTDAPINPGNSGGVLLNSEGKVIGITAAMESRSGSSSGVGFAIPSAIAQKVVPVLIKTGHFDHPYLGISGGTLAPSLAQAMNLKVDQRGALVGSVTRGGPAEKAGLRGSTQPATIDGQSVNVGGDVIIAFNGTPVKTFDDLVAYLARMDVNQNVTLTILRDGKEQTIQIILAARPSA